MSKYISQILLLHFSFLLNYIISQKLEGDALKAFSCISILKLLNPQNMDQQKLSTYLLSCFINIDDQTIERLASSHFTKTLERKKMERIVDYSQIAGRYTQEDIVAISERLNKAIRQLEKSEYYQGGRRSDEKQKKGKSEQGANISLIELMIGYIIGLLNPKDSFIFLIGYFLLAYFLLKGLRKLCSQKKTNNGVKTKKVKKK